MEKRRGFFDTLREAEVWAHSLSNEISVGAMDGYQTTDHKIAFALAFYLALVPENIVHTYSDGLLYKVWVDPST